MPFAVIGVLLCNWALKPVNFSRILPRVCSFLMLTPVSISSAFSMLLMAQLWGCASLSNNLSCPAATALRIAPSLEMSDWLQAIAELLQAYGRQNLPVWPLWGVDVVASPATAWRRSFWHHRWPSSCTPLLQGGVQRAIWALKQVPISIFWSSSHHCTVTFGCWQNIYSSQRTELFGSIEHQQLASQSKVKFVWPSQLPSEHSHRYGENNIWISFFYTSEEKTKTCENNYKRW